MKSSEELEVVRDNLQKIKLKKLANLDDDLGNLSDILKEYDIIASTAKDLIHLPGKKLIEGLTTQPSEYFFFKTCHGYIKHIHDDMENLLRYTRGVEYSKIRSSKSNVSDLTERAITQLIDGNMEVRERSFQTLMVKETLDRFTAIIESYQQRGYQLNNITKAYEAQVHDFVL